MSDSLHRVYVGGLPPKSSDTELSALISKIAPVASIYIPDIAVTGLHRGFAIVEISGTDELLKKCTLLITVLCTID
jgi:RNA recognition motif-containing protein